jgi:hypothetical protein
MSTDLQEMINALWLTDEWHWDLALYWIILLNVVLLFTMPEGSTLGTSLCILVIVLAIIDKVYGFGYMLDTGGYDPVYYHEKIFIGTYLIRAGMFVGPLMIAGQTDSGSTRAIGILGGLSGGAYMFIRWYMEQQNVGSGNIGFYIDLEMLPYGLSLLFVLRRSLCRRFDYVTVDGLVPVAVAGDLAAHDVEVKAA